MQINAIVNSRIHRPHNTSVTAYIREGNATPLQYSCLENPMDGGAWWAAVHGIAKSRTRLRDFTFTFHFHALEKEMATYSSVLAWRIPGTGEPGGLLSMELHRVRHNWSNLAAAVAAGLRLLFFFLCWLFYKKSAWHFLYTSISKKVINGSKEYPVSN